MMLNRNRWAILFMTVIWVWTALFSPVMAGDQSLQLSTQTQVSESGQVVVALTVRNASSRPLFHIHPMFHFHHTMSHMKMVPRLDPGESVTLTNSEHPPVRRVGSYPVVVMVNYNSSSDGELTATQVHTNSFYFQERLLPAIQGTVDTTVHNDSSTLKFHLKNTSGSFKNVRLMLLLPPELQAEEFNGMMGFTIRGGEEKKFEIPVKRVLGQAAGAYPVHLLIEYGEMLKHYSGDISGQIYFGAPWGQGPFWPQMLVFVFIFSMLTLSLYRRRQYRSKSQPAPLP